MAIRKVRELGDDVLRKQSKEVKAVTPRVLELIDDMFDTIMKFKHDSEFDREIIDAFFVFVAMSFL